VSQNQGLYRPNQLKRARSGRRAEAAARELYREEQKLKLKPGMPSVAVSSVEPSRRVSDLLFRNAELRKQVEQLQVEVSQWRKRVEVMEQIIADTYAHEAKPVEIVILKKIGRP